MDVKVKNRLAAIGIRINNNTIPIFRKTPVASNTPCRKQQMAQCSLVSGTGFIERIDMFARNDKNMRRCLWDQIVKGYASIILVDTLGRYPTVGNFTKNAVFHAHIDSSLLKHRLSGLLIIWRLRRLGRQTPYPGFQ